MNPKAQKAALEFETKARSKHGGKYNYDLVYYVNSSIKVKVICPEHGVFEVTPNNHLRGKGCAKCAGNSLLDTMSFVTKSNVVHGNKYDYSLVDYVNNKTNVRIICSKHGVFEQPPDRHLGGAGCLKCCHDKSSIDQRKNVEQFVGEARRRHGDKYDYSLVDYVNTKTNVKVICPEHGIFEVTPHSHLKGDCAKCAGNSLLDTMSFVTKSNVVHGNKYDYSLVKYVNSKTNVKIICSKHGVFKQPPDRHLGGAGCPKCRASHGEKRIRDYLVKNGISFKEQVSFGDCVNVRKLKFDFCVLNECKEVHRDNGVEPADISLLIEYQGQQHYQLIYWKKMDKSKVQKRFEQGQINDQIKREWCKKQGMHLLEISYKDFDRIEEILKQAISAREAQLL